MVWPQYKSIGPKCGVLCTFDPDTTLFFPGFPRGPGCCLPAAPKVAIYCREHGASRAHCSHTTFHSVLQLTLFKKIITSQIMGKEKDKGKGSKTSSSSQPQPAEEKQLWEINDVMIFNHYNSFETEDGQTYYTRKSDRIDLPESFWHDGWCVISLKSHPSLNQRFVLIIPFIREVALEERKAAEKLVESSGREAQSVRQAGSTYSPDYELPSQRIANNPNMGLISSSTKAAKQRRKKRDGEE